MNGYIISNLEPGKAMELYQALKLDRIGSQVVITLNADGEKKDRIEIDELCDLDMDIIGYVNPGAEVATLKGEESTVTTAELPEKLVNYLVCKNPRCISATEQELTQIFKLSDRKKKKYRCLYCEAEA